MVYLKMYSKTLRTKMTMKCARGKGYGILHWIWRVTDLLSYLYLIFVYCVLCINIGYKHIYIYTQTYIVSFSTANLKLSTKHCFVACAGDLPAKLRTLAPHLGVKTTCCLWNLQVSTGINHILSITFPILAWTGSQVDQLTAMKETDGNGGLFVRKPAALAPVFVWGSRGGSSLGLKAAFNFRGSQHCGSPCPLAAWHSHCATSIAVVQYETFINVPSGTNKWCCSECRWL